MMSLLSALEMSAAAVLCGAMACPPEDGECVVDVQVQSVPSGANLTLVPQIAFALDGDQESNSVVKVIIHNENGALEYSDENGAVSVTHDGQPVPADRIARDGDAVRILGESGETLFEFTVGRAGTGRVIQLDRPGRIMLGDQNVRGFAMAPSRGRIGVYLSATDEAARAENRVESETAVTITEVIEGSPAAEAGLQSNDIVVRINGQTASDETLRTIIGETEPGEEVTLRIVRAGEPQDVRVRVEASPAENVAGEFDVLLHHPEMQEFTVELDDLQTRIGDIQDHLLRVAPDGDWTRFGNLEELGQLHPEFLEQLNEKFGEGRQFYQLHVLPHLEGQQHWLREAGPHAEAIREKVLEALRNADLNLDEETQQRIHEAVHEALHSALQGLHNVGVTPDDAPVLFDLMERAEGDHIMVLPEGGRFRMMQPGELRFEGTLDVAAQPEGSAADRLQRLEERLEKLEALLEQLVERQGRERLP